MGVGILKSICLLALVLTFLLPPHLAEAQPANAQGQTTTIGPRKQLATIIFSGLAGAILGLSTLSFYGRPQDHLSNIAVGFAVGIIAGTVYTIYQAATKPKTYFETMLPQIEQEQVLAAQFAAQPAGEILQPSLKWEWDF